jgi:hypothetical protein
VERNSSIHRNNMKSPPVTNSLTPRGRGVLKDANSHSASQEISRLLSSPSVHYPVHKIPELVPILSQMHSVNTFLPYFLKIRSNIILPSTPRSSEWYIPFRFSERNSVPIFHLFHACNMPRPSHPP